MSDTIVLGLKLADQEVLSGNDCGTTKATNDSESTIERLAATTSLFKLIFRL